MPSFSDFAGFEGFLFVADAQEVRWRPTAPAHQARRYTPSNLALVSQQNPFA
jgi:hypothetical protein